MLLVGCVSPKVITVEKTVVPELSFPVFPLADSMTLNTDGTVTVPGNWVVRLREYQLRIEETEDTYNEIKSLYEGSADVQ